MLPKFELNKLILVQNLENTYLQMEVKTFAAVDKTHGNLLFYPIGQVMDLKPGDNILILLARYFQQ